MKYIKLLKEEFSKWDKPIFNVTDLNMIPGLSNSYRRLMIHNLFRKGFISKVTRGVYTFHRDASVLCFAFSPSYYGLENALTIRGLSLQGTNPIIITPRNVRTGVRTFIDRNYVIYRIKPEFFFGYELVKREELWIPVSDLEKTIIDMAYFGKVIRDELWRNILPSLDMKRLRLYLEKYTPQFRDELLASVGEARKLKILYPTSSSRA